MSKAVEKRVEHLEKELLRTSVLNWDCWGSRDVKQLAENVRTVSELALLAYTGLRTMKGGPPSVDGVEWTILDDVLNMAALGSFVLSRELGAVEEAE